MQMVKDRSPLLLLDVGTLSLSWTLLAGVLSLNVFSAQSIYIAEPF